MAKRGGNPLSARTKGTNKVDLAARGGVVQPGKYSIDKYLPGGTGPARKAGVPNNRASAGTSGRATLGKALAKQSNAQRAKGVTGSPMMPKPY